MSDYFVGQEALSLHKTAQAVYGDAPAPYCDRCRKLTGYFRVPYSKEDAGTNLILGMMKPNYFMADDHVYIAYTLCGNCLGFDDGFRLISMAQNLNAPESFFVSYKQGYEAGRNFREAKDKDDRKKKIYAEVAVKLQEESLRREIMNELRPGISTFQGGL